MPHLYLAPQPRTIARFIETTRGPTDQNLGAPPRWAGPTLTRTLAAANLVDEWRLTLHPVILGGGLSLFPQIEERTPLQLRSSKTFRTGVIAAHYVAQR